MASEPLTPFGSALAGALGAVCSNTLVYPLDTVKTRLQALPPSSTPETPVRPSSKPRDVKGIKHLLYRLLKRIRRWDMLTLLIKIVKTEGLAGVFKGYTANMINTFSMQFAYFFFHTLLRKQTIHQLSLHSNSSSPTSLSTTSELLLGAAAGGLAQIFTIPVSVVATRQQLWTPPPSSTSSPKGKNVKGLSLLETAKEIIDESGPSGLWTGLKPGLVLTVNPAITYGAFERLKSYVLTSSGREGGRLGLTESFLIGVISKAIATVVTYPYIFAKVRLQAKAGAGESIKDTAAQAPPSASSGTYAAVASAIPELEAPIVSGPEIEKDRDPAAGGSKTSGRRNVKQQGAIPLLMAVYRQKGFAGWYQGLSAQVIKAVLCQGILFVSKDQFERWAEVILLLLSRLRARIPLLSGK